MEQKNLIIICITLIFCVAICSATMIFLNQDNVKDTTENSSVNITLNDSENNTNATTTKTSKASTKTDKKSSSESEYGDYIEDEWVSMSEEEYAERYPALYHEQALSEGKYDKYHPEFYEIDRENGRI